MINILDWQSFNEGYNKPRAGGKRRWSLKYKKKINCSNPKGFSQIQYCKRKRRGGHYKTESLEYNHVREIINNLSNMSLDLWDKHFNVQISESVLSPDEKFIVINIVKPTGHFTYEEVKDDFLQMYYYLTEQEKLNLSFIDGILKLSAGHSQKYLLGVKNDDLCFLYDDVVKSHTSTLFQAKRGEKVEMPIEQLIIKFRQ